VIIPIQLICINRMRMDCEGPVPLWVDAVEKVRSMPPTRNNRINETYFLNRSCASQAILESMLLGRPLKLFFLTVSTISGRTRGKKAG